LVATEQRIDFPMNPGEAQVFSIKVPASEEAAPVTEMPADIPNLAAAPTPDGALADADSLSDLLDAGTAQGAEPEVAAPTPEADGPVRERGNRNGRRRQRREIAHAPRTGSARELADG
jgi:hypothetical protein